MKLYAQVWTAIRRVCPFNVITLEGVSTLRCRQAGSSSCPRGPARSRPCPPTRARAACVRATPLRLYIRPDAPRPRHTSMK